MPGRRRVIPWKELLRDGDQLKTHSLIKDGHEKGSPTAALFYFIIVS